MKLRLGLGLLVLALSGCVSTLYPTLNKDYTNEQWQSEVDTNPNAWIQGTSHWFLTGDPTIAENTNAPVSAAMSTMQVKVPNFSTIKTNGSCQVQLFGTNEANSVYIVGPNAAIRQINVQVKNGLLCIDQGDKPGANLKDVVVRIGVQELSYLTHQGSGSVEGLRLRSHALVMDMNATGYTVLSGDLNVKKIISQGNGSVTVLGANTPVLDVIMNGCGTVNIGGNVGLRQLDHKGSGDFNLIGANSDGLSVYGQGSGKIGINGTFNAKEVQAHNNVCILMKGSNSQSTYAYVYDNAKIGMSGWARNLTIYTAQNGKFWGRYLKSENAYARASDASHINVTASTRIFASATGNASVYFYGEPSLLSQFVSGRGVVIPIWMNTNSAKPRYKDSSSVRVYKDTSDAPQFRWVNGKLQEVQPK